jgi:serine acetyltransferase
MANTKISQLPIWTGTAADLRWFVMNNSGETETYKYSGYTSQLVPGTGINSYRTIDAISTNNSSIAIGFGANAQGDDAVSIGNTFGQPVGFRSVVIGRHPYPPGIQNLILGSGAYVYGNNSIVLGHETSAGSNAIVVGSNTSRANGNYAITLGHQNEQNLSAYSVVLGTNNRIGIAPTFLGSEYSVVIGSNHRVETNANYRYNTILGGDSNTISGATSGVTLLSMTNYSPTTNDAAFAMNYVMTNYASLNFPDDTAAAAGGVVLGQMYHTGGVMKIRIV